MWIAAPIAVLALAGATIAVAARGQTAPVPLDSNHIPICHAEGNGTWHLISPDDNSIIGNNGHAGHDGDIIPPFDYQENGETKHFPGLNWNDDGRAIYFPAGDKPACVAPIPVPPEPKPQFPIGVFVSCTSRSSNTFSVTFGYDNNANPGPVRVPVGDANVVAPGGPGRGQPEEFLGGYVGDAFQLDDIPIGEVVTWSVTYGGKTQTATAVATLCGEDTKIEVTVSVACVEPGPTTFTARFGYHNRGDVRVPVQHGDANQFVPEPKDRGQPIVFLPGENADAVTVSGIPNGSSLEWRLTTGGVTRSATASVDSPRCSSTPSPPEPELPVPPLPPVPPDPQGEPIGVFVDCIRDNGATYDVVFGYQSENEDPISIPAGTANGFRPLPPADRGQVTEFLPGNIQRAFTVEDVGRGAELTWAVTYAGETHTATSSSLYPTQCEDDPEAPEPIGIFACIVDRGTTFDVQFGYENDNPVAVSLPIGVRNHVDPGGPNRGQPIIFVPGREANAFSVRGVQKTQFVSWTLSYRGLRSVIVTEAYPVACGGAEPDRSIRPFDLCIRRTGNTYTAVFGYTNLNREDVIVPVGPRNRVSPGPADQGQPTTFRGGNAYAEFGVRDVPIDRAVTWSVTTFGTVRTATANIETRECVRTPVEDPVDVAITKVVRPATVAAGQRVDYTIIVRNVGSTTAYAVTVNDVPADERVRLTSAATSRGRCGFRDRDGPGQVVTCFLGDMAPGDSATIAIGGRAVAEGTARNRALVLSLPLDSGANNSAVTSVRVEPGSGVLGVGVRPPFTG